MEETDTLTEIERLLLMAALACGLKPDADLDRANAVRVVNQTLRWLGLSADEIRNGWKEPESDPLHENVYDALVRMTHQIPDRAPERPGPPLFEGGGNWGIPGDPASPAAWPHFNSCRMTKHGERIAVELAARHPELRVDIQRPTR